MSKTNHKAGNRAKIELIDCVARQADRVFTVKARLTNTGDVTWQSGCDQNGVFAVALRAKRPSNTPLSSNWYSLPKDVPPGDELVVKTDFTIPEESAGLHWKLDLVESGVMWFSDSETEAAGIDLKNARHLTTEDRPEIDQLKYLEQIIDFENNMDNGLLSDKKVLVYAPAKTGSCSLREYVVQSTRENGADKMEYRHVLHAHHNKALIKSIKPLTPMTAKSDFRDRMIARDLVEYKRLKGQSVLLVSSFREPLSRAISHVMHNLNHRLVLAGSLAPGDVDFDECTNLLNYFIADVNFKHPVEEVEPGLFHTEVFDKTHKYFFADRGHYRILLVCLEHADFWPQAFQNEFGFRHTHIPVRNRSSQKKIAQIYSDYTDQLRLPEADIHKIYFDGPFARYVRWFYTDEEIEAFYQQSLHLYGADRK